MATEVPILTQPGGWALHYSVCKCQRSLKSSNPHPARRLGATPRIFAESAVQALAVPILTQPGGWALPATGQEQARLKKFQSSPSPEAGRYIKGRPNVNKQLVVPILTQPGGWALRHASSQVRRWLQFQSSPSPEAGRYS